MNVVALVASVLMLAACQSASPLFDINRLQPGEEDTRLVGWLRVANDGSLSLFPTRSAGKDCVTVRPLSLAGVVPASYDWKQMAIEGRLTRDGAGACAVAILAHDISAP